MTHFQAAPRAGMAALAAVLMMILAGCGGGGSGNGGGTAPPPTGNPDPNPPQPTLSRLTLTGTVTDAPIANAVVTATVGGQTFTANADANGNYSLEIALPQSATGGFVTLSAKGVGSQSYVEFTSLVGTFSSLLSQAGSDATLSSAENFGTQITNVSTALAVLLREKNGGQPVTSEASLQALSATLNSQDVLDLATAIKLLVDATDRYPLPDGVISLSALLANTAAREQFVNDVSVLDWATFVNTQNAIVSDATLTRPIMPTTVPSNLVAATLPTARSYSYIVDRAVAYNFNADGTGTETTSSWHRNFTWRLAAGGIELVYQELSPAQPLEMAGYERRVCLEDPFYYGYGVKELLVQYTVARATLRRLSDRILAVTEDRHITYRECGDPGTTEPVTVARTVIDASNTQPIDADELRNTTRTLWIYDADSDGAEQDTTRVIVMPDIADLYPDGTGSTLYFNKRFTWALDASGKVITATFTDGTVAKYSVLREIGDVETDVLYDVALPTGGRRIGAGVSILAEQPFAFTPDSVVGRHYWQGVGEDGAPAERKGFRLRLDADGTGSRENEILDAAGNVVVVDVNRHPNWGFFWHIAVHDLVLERTREELGGGYSCSVEQDPLCYVYDERRLMPITRNGARTYSLELFRSRSSGESEFSRRQTYIGMYEHEPFGAPALSVKPQISSVRRLGQTRSAPPASSASPERFFSAELGRAAAR